MKITLVRNVLLLKHNFKSKFELNDKINQNILQELIV